MRNTVCSKLSMRKACFDNGCNLLTLKWLDEMTGDVCRSRLVRREIKRAKNRDEQLGPDDAFSPMPPSVGLKIAGFHDDDGTRRWKSHRWTDRRGNVGCVRSALARRSLAGGCTHTCLKGVNRRANWPDSAGAVTEREMQRQSEETHGQKC